MGTSVVGSQSGLSAAACVSLMHSTPRKATTTTSSPYVERNLDHLRASCCGIPPPNNSNDTPKRPRCVNVSAWDE